MKEENFKLMLNNYDEINPEEMYEIEGGGILKLVIIGGVIIFGVGVVNGCSSTQ